MAMNDGFGLELNDGLQGMIASLNFGVLGLGEDMNTLNLTIDAMNSLLQNNNSALTQFSKNLNKFLADLNSLPTVVSGNNDADTPKFDKPPTTVAGAVETGIALAAANDSINRKLSNQGFSASQVKQADEEADDLRQIIPGSSEVADLNAIFDLQTAFHNPVEAMQAVAGLLKSGVITNSTNGDNEKDVGQSALNAANFDTLSDNFFNKKTQTVNQDISTVLNNGLADFALANGGSTTEYFQNANRSVVSQITSKDLFASIAPIIVALKSQQVAPGLAALQQAFNPKNLSQSGLAFLQQIGVKPGGAVYASNPAAWLEDVLIPALKSHGYNTQSQQDAFIETALKGSSFLPGLQGILAHLEEIEDYKEKYDNVADNPKNSFGSIVNSNAIIESNAATNALDMFLTTIAKAGTSQVVGGLHYLTAFVNALNNYNENHSAAAAAEMDALTGAAVVVPALGIVKGAKILAALKNKFLAGGAEAGGEADIAEALAASAGIAEITAATGGTVLVLIAGAALYELIKNDEAADQNKKNGTLGRSPGEARFGYYYMHDEAYYTDGSSTGSPYIPPVTSADDQNKIYNVWVVNPDDIHGGTAKAIAQHFSVQTGTTGHNAALSPPLPSGSFL